MTTKTPHPVDIRVGKNIRAFRRTKGLSQTELANGLGIKFQQVQKYETGANRISASKMFDAASILGCKVSDFYLGLSDNADDQRTASLLNEASQSAEGIEFASMILALPTEKRQAMLDMAETMKENAQGGPETYEM